MEQCTLTVNGSDGQMKIIHQLLKKVKNQRGAVAIMVAIAVTFFLIGFAALAVDVGYLFASKNELQNAADAAALAGAGLLGQIYANMTNAQQQTYDCTQDTWSDAYGSDCESIRAQAQDVVGTGKNPAGGKDIIIDVNDIYINTWGGSKFNTNNTVQPDAVRVIARRDDSANGPITTFFAKIFGMDTAIVTADATAALTGPAQVDEGQMNLPIGLSYWQFFDNCDDSLQRQGICSEEIQFSPTTDSCAGWHNFFDPINANAMKNKLLGFIAGNDEPCLEEPCGESWLDAKFGENNPPDGAETPVTTAGSSLYYFQGGTISSLFTGKYLEWEDGGSDPEDIRTEPVDADGDGKQDVSGSGQIAPFIALFDYFRFRDGDNNNAVWTATAPVYEDNCPCDNPNTQRTIKGFAQVTVRMPNPPPDSTVTATVDCNWTAIVARGGGGTFGNLKGTIPSLVE
jgi:Flp pilus assembly protein TadG